MHKRNTKNGARQPTAGAVMATWGETKRDSGSEGGSGAGKPTVNPGWENHSISLCLTASSKKWRIPVPTSEGYWEKEIIHVGKYLTHCWEQYIVDEG